jgi:eukaryotic-like serine/threonine-protein kinase
MGEVYRARDPRLGREVAIKVLPEDSTADPERLRRFELEARAVGALSHANLLAVFDTGRHEGAPFMVFELLDGETLRARLGGGALPPPKALDYAIQMARGLAAAHEKGIVHRDLKPDNLFLTRDGHLKILDFGLAKLRPPLDPGDVNAETRTASVHTEAHTILGTVGYMSPEQVRRSPVDHRSDIFSFGLVLYEMLSGSRPFRGGTEPETMTAILNQDLPPLTEATGKVPVALERIMRHCVEKRPEDRFQSARDLVFGLEAVAQAAAAGAPGWPPRAGRRLRLAMVAGVAVLALLAAGGVRNWFASGTWSAHRTAPMSLVPITSLSGWETNPALSPDGTQVAFSWDDRGPVGHGDISVQLIGAGTPLRLTTDSADNRSPAWSPDGHHIAFLRCLGSEQGIFTVPALGGPERKLQATGCPALAWDEGRGLDWSDDGKLLVFAAKTSADGFSIFLLSIETLEKQRLTFPPAEHQADVRPAFSPDGRSVAFARVGGTRESSLFVVPVAGGEPRRVSFGDVWTGGVPSGHTWNPHGSSIVASWAPGTYGGSGSVLWKVPATGGVPEQVGVGGDNASQPSISRRGNRLAFVQTHIDTDTWEIGMSGSPPRGHSPRKVISSSRRDDGPQLSPDGRKIAFESHRSGRNEVWICDRNGANAVQMTRFGAVTGTPRWSPDGRRIAFDSDKEGQVDVYVLEVAGGLPLRLTPEGSLDAVPSWSADGRWVYFGSNRTGSFEVWKMPAEGGPALQVTRNGGFAAFESPDGSRLYYAKFEAAGIWTVPVNGGEEQPVHDLPPTGYWGYWGIGHRGLYFVNPEAKPRPAIDLFDLATRRVTRIAEMERQPMQWTSGFSVARDERSILYSQWEQSGSDIMLVEGFR